MTTSRIVDDEPYWSVSISRALAEERQQQFSQVHYRTRLYARLIRADGLTIQVFVLVVRRKTLPDQLSL